MFIRFTASAFPKLLSVYVFSYFPFGFEGRMWDLIVSVPDHCLSFYFLLKIIRFRLILNTITNCNQLKKLISHNWPSSEISFHCRNQVIEMASFI